ncbi:MAG TPA: tetratricopeptide repeat protein [Pontiellaceae bacterium]|nr:tetratricopeptide repeat protein [Pontiellaceae bacterium]
MKKLTLLTAGSVTACLLAVSSAVCWAQTPQENSGAAAAQRAAEIAAAKAAAARDPQNWRVFNDLGAVYYRQAQYDQAVAAFQQALSLHSITTIIEAEKKQADEAAAQRAAMNAKREADIQRAKDLQSKQEMNELFGLVSGVAGMNGNMQAQMMASTLQTVNNQINSVPNSVPPLSPEMKMESSLKAKSEVSGLYISLGFAYFGKKDYQQAILSFDNALQLDPSRTEVLKTSAEALYFLCKYDECITTFAKYHAIAPVEPASLLRLSDAYRALGMHAESDKAFAAFLAGQERYAADCCKLLEIGTVCLSHWRYEEALNFLTKARQVAAGSPDQSRRFIEAQRARFQMTNAISLLLAEAQFNLRQTAEATALLREAVAQDGSNSKAWYMLAQCHDQAGESAAAQEAYGKALAAFGAAKTKAPDYIQVCRAAAGEGDEAVKALETQLAGVPLTPGGGANQWCVLALAFEKAGRIPEAMEILSRCCEVSPAYTRARLALTRLEQQAAAERKRILAEADAALAAGNRNQALAKLADVYRLTAAGKEKEAVRKTLLKTAAGLEPAPAMNNSAQDHYLRGSVALKTAKNPLDLSRALSEFQWAVFYSPWVGDLYFNTSAVKKLQNQTAAAVGDLKLYLAAKPDAANVGEILNRLYEFDYQQEQKLRELAAVAAF